MALAIQPSKQYIKYEGDVDYWTNVAGIQVADIVSVRGSKYYDGVYTVTGFVQYNSDHYMTVAGRAITDEVAFTVDTDGSYGNSTTGPIPIADSADVRVGQTITGNNIQAGKNISAIP